MPFDMKELLLKLGALLRKLRCDRVVIYSVFYQTWIKKKNRHVKHSRPRNDEVPATKRVKLTPWQAYMKDFGKSLPITLCSFIIVEGLMEKQTASRAYKSMSAAQKEELTKKCSDKATYSQRH